MVSWKRTAPAIDKLPLNSLLRVIAGCGRTEISERNRDVFDRLALSVRYLMGNETLVRLRWPSAPGHASLGAYHKLLAVEKFDTDHYRAARPHAFLGEDSWRVLHAQEVKVLTEAIDCVQILAQESAFVESWRSYVTVTFLNYHG